VLELGSGPPDERAVAEFLANVNGSH
jgi:hypothetical protein